MNTSDKKLVYLLVGLPAVVIAFFLGLYVGDGNSSGVDHPDVPQNIITDEQFAPFWQAWQTLQEKSIYAASTTDQTKIWGSIEGLAASYGDPYTVFFPPQEAKIFKEDITGNFGGVGMEIGIKDDNLVVVAPLKDSPAEKAGVRAGDIIVSINGTSTVKMGTDEAVSLIRGPKGTPIKITFWPKGAAKAVERTIIRDTINPPVLDVSEKPGGITVIKLYSFTANSADLFRNALRQFVISGNHKLILDLRRNPGGYLDAAWDMASYFLPAGKKVVTEDFGKNAEPVIYMSKGYNVFNKNLEMVILVDGGSASASEILAGALQEHGVAKLVGTKTFGKGSVQELVPMAGDASLKVTIARWLTPQGHNLSQDGLNPDFIATSTDAEIAAGKDTVMDKALKLLEAQP